MPRQQSAPVMDYRGTPVYRRGGKLFVKAPGNPRSHSGDMVGFSTYVAEEGLGRRLKPGEVVWTFAEFEDEPSFDSLLVFGSRGDMSSFVHNGYDMDRLTKGDDGAYTCERKSRIVNGTKYFTDGLRCIDCGKPLTNKSSVRCMACSKTYEHAQRGVAGRPEPMRLVETALELGFQGASERLGTSNQNLRLWCEAIGVDPMDVSAARKGDKTCRKRALKVAAMAQRLHDLGMLAPNGNLKEA